jgi:protein TonB
MGFGFTSMAIFLGLSGLSLVAIRHRDAIRPRTLDLQLVPDAFIYNVSNASAGRYDPVGGGGKDEPAAPDKEGPSAETTKLWNEVMDMMAAEAPTAAQEDPSERTMIQPGAIQVPRAPTGGYVPAFHAQMAAQGSGGGTGGGVGSGDGPGNGSGHGTNPNLGFLADGSGTGIPMKMEELTVNYQEDPIYPSKLKMSGTEGEVLVRITISEWGIPVRTEVKNASDPLFAEEVVRALPHWRFKPVKVNGSAVRISVVVLFDFHLLRNNAKA